MNPKAQEEFDAILAKSLESLTEYDMAILRCRASYLSEEEKEKYGLIEKEVVEVKKVVKKKK